ncbi:hypothetical protein RJT34_29732 [Clitoria ternatea]|uniref:Uncharacterized protein n=1 Tax=Clitoria ternatea TaxID=43366 RepID=A0AAN9ETD2_CLITE
MSGRPRFTYRKRFGNRNAAETRETAQKRGGNVSPKIFFVLPLFSFFPSRVTPTARKLRCCAPHRTARHCRARSTRRRPSSSPPASLVFSELCIFWSVLLLLPSSDLAAGYPTHGRLLQRLFPVEVDDEAFVRGAHGGGGGVASVEVEVRWRWRFGGGGGLEVEVRWRWRWRFGGGGSVEMERKGEIEHGGGRDERKGVRASGEGKKCLTEKVLID